MKKNVYGIAYNLGISYLNCIKYDPSFAVMFDIDDTLLYSKNFKGIKPIINLLNECNKRNFKVIIITARDSIYTEDTIQDLLNIGIYPNQDNLYNSNYYDYIYLRHSPKDNHNLFKSDIKKKLYDNGIQTIMSIGDNEVDINGNYSGYAIKLPNTKDPRLFHKNNLGQMVNVKV